MCSLSLLCVRRLNFLLLQPVHKSDSIQFRPLHTEVNQSNVVKIPRTFMFKCTTVNICE